MVLINLLLSRNIIFAGLLLSDIKNIFIKVKKKNFHLIMFYVVITEFVHLTILNISFKNIV